MDERVESLERCAVLSEFTDVGRRILAAVVRERLFTNAQALLKQGEAPRENAVMFVVSGRVRCEVRDAESAVLVLGTLGPGDHLGGLRLFGEGPAAVSAIAEGEVRVLVLDRAAFARVQKHKPHTAMKLLFALSSDFGRRLGEQHELFADFALFAARRANARERQFASLASLGLEPTPSLPPNDPRR